MAEQLVVFNNDLVPAGRKKLTPHHLQVGDCCLRIPPLSIDVRAVSNVNLLRGLRQRNPILTQSGYNQTEIRAQLWFNSLADINGVEVPGAGGETYSMDGLRPLVAQFRRTPILPVFNELINDTHGIHVGILSNLTVETVPDFPGVLSGTLLVHKTTVEPYMLVPDAAFADYICWPVFRWYYQRLMHSRGAEYLSKVDTTHFTGSFGFSVINEDTLMAADKEGRGLLPGDRATGKSQVYINDGFEIVKINGEDRAIMPATRLALKLGLPVESRPPNIVIGGHNFRPYKMVDKMAWVLVRQVGETLGYAVSWHKGTIVLERSAGKGAAGGDLEEAMVNVEMPDTLHLVHLAVALGNAFANTYVQMHSTPCHQYLGGMDKQIIATFETRDREAVVALKSLAEVSNYYSLRYRNRLVSGFIGFRNELVSLFGIRYVILQDIHVTTVPGHPDLFRITLSMMEYDRMQRAYERAAALSYIENLPSLQSGVTSINTFDLSDIEVACLVEEMLEGFNLYPDLDLPMHVELGQAIGQINDQRGAYGLKPVKLGQPDPTSKSPFVDPDFYIDYTHLSA